MGVWVVDEVCSDYSDSGPVPGFQSPGSGGEWPASGDNDECARTVGFSTGRVTDRLKSSMTVSGYLASIS